MSQSLLQAKVDATVRFAISFFAMLVGFALSRGPLALVGVFVATVGAIQAARAFGRVIRLFSIEEQHRRMAGGGWDSGDWRQASLPRRIFWLLYHVAEVDGRSGAREIDLVRRFLLERFLAPDALRDLAHWQAPPISADRLGELARSIRSDVSGSECETIFEWSCCIALIDERFTSLEHEMLQTVSDALGLQGIHAQHLFRRAKARVLEATAAGGAGRNWQQHRQGDRHGGWQGDWRGDWRSGWRGGWQGRADAGARRRAPDPRKQALDVLGLDADADKTAIRKRHRELVKRYHPDAHASLGEIAAREAGERFKEVQRAYEYLVKN